MRVLVAGASGAIGTRLVPRLIDAGHEVIGTHKSAGSGERVRALGAEPVQLDLLDRDAVVEAVVAGKPDSIVHEATALGGDLNFKHFDRSFHQTSLLRTQGTDALLAGAKAAGVERFVAQSYASMRHERTGGMVKTEDDPLDSHPVPAMSAAMAAMRYLDETVTAAGGIVLRYGGFYGAANDGLIEPVRKRMFPIVGDGAGVTSFIHLDDAAAATVLAEALGAKPPRRVPRWLARLFAGELAVMMGTESRGVSNAKARRELGWTPRYPSWRDGFVATYASNARADRGAGRLVDPVNAT